MKYEGKNERSMDLSDDQEARIILSFSFKRKNQFFPLSMKSRSQNQI